MTPLTELLGLVTVIVTGSVVAGAVVFMCVRARSSSGWFRFKISFYIYFNILLI